MTPEIVSYRASIPRKRVTQPSSNDRALLFHNDSITMSWKDIFLWLTDFNRQQIYRTIKQSREYKSATYAWSIRPNMWRYSPKPF